MKTICEAWHDYYNGDLYSKKSKKEILLDLVRKDAKATTSIKRMKKKLENCIWLYFRESGIESIYTDRLRELHDAEAKTMAAHCQTAEEARNLYYSAPHVYEYKANDMIIKDSKAGSIYKKRRLELAENEVKIAPEPKTAQEAANLWDTLPSESRLKSIYFKKYIVLVRKESSMCKTIAEAKEKAIFFKTHPYAADFFERRQTKLMDIAAKKLAKKCKTAIEAEDLYDSSDSSTKASSIYKNRYTELANRDAMKCKTIEDVERLFYSVPSDTHVQAIYAERWKELSAKL